MALKKNKNKEKILSLFFTVHISSISHLTEGKCKLLSALVCHLKIRDFFFPLSFVLHVCPL